LDTFAGRIRRAIAARPAAKQTTDRRGAVTCRWVDHASSAWCGRLAVMLAEVLLASPHLQPSVASAHAVRLRSGGLHIALGPHGITVNAVAPGLVRTDAAREWLNQQDPEVERLTAERAMMRRLGEPKDIAHTIAFLAAPESGWLTAQVPTVDGGRMDYIGHA